MVIDCETDPEDALYATADSDDAIIREALNRHADALDSIMQQHRATAANTAGSREGRILPFLVLARAPDHAGGADLLDGLHKEFCSPFSILTRICRLNLARLTRNRDAVPLNR
ncbi:hypothetical protein HGP14_23540 [Rhizobium sp. P32RR-XVIII]|uniref:hypothetical protein n=1 Tax=Rhizobium sp. P32RR-XVIII TaxID=2726738 RepID=UPI001456F713|nr:hypothetical protein [Rhizobium sp. P32RR-XVIII]NLS06297.1 hypothetical protein [Rhizobium sp. P32RR-XVIII]